MSIPVFLAAWWQLFTLFMQPVMILFAMDRLIRETSESSFACYALLATIYVSVFTLRIVEQGAYPSTQSIEKTQTGRLRDFKSGSTLSK